MRIHDQSKWHLVVYPILGVFVLLLGLGGIAGRTTYAQLIEKFPSQPPSGVPTQIENAPGEVTNIIRLNPCMEAKRLAKDPIASPYVDASWVDAASCDINTAYCVALAGRAVQARVSPVISRELDYCSRDNVICVSVTGGIQGQTWVQLSDNCKLEAPCKKRHCEQNPVTTAEGKQIQRASCVEEIAIDGTTCQPVAHLPAPADPCKLYACKEGSCAESGVNTARAECLPPQVGTPPGTPGEGTPPQQRVGETPTPTTDGGPGSSLEGSGRGCLLNAAASGGSMNLFLLWGLMGIVPLLLRRRCK